MTYKSTHDGPLSEPMSNLIKAIDALFNTAQEIAERALKKIRGEEFEP